MDAFISATNVSSICSGSVVHSFIICRGAPADMTVTADAPSGEPRSTDKGSHEVFSSSSATQ